MFLDLCLGHYSPLLCADVLRICASEFLALMRLGLDVERRFFKIKTLPTSMMERTDAELLFDLSKH